MRTGLGARGRVPSLMGDILGGMTFSSAEVLVKAPFLLLSGVTVLWLGMNALLQNLAIMLWNTSAWVALAPLWMTLSLAPAIMATRLFRWLPAIWKTRRSAPLRALTTIAVYAGVMGATALVFTLQWTLLHWIGAAEEATRLMEGAPEWALAFGLLDPHHAVRWPWP